MKTRLEKISEFSDRYWLLEIFVGLIGFGAMNLIFFSKAFNGNGGIEREAAGHLGDFVGGYVGTFFSLIGVVFLLRTLNSQKNSATRQSFENKYYEMLKLHRDNVSEIQIGGAIGRRAFVMMIREYRCILEVIEEVLTLEALHIDKLQKQTIAYYVLFFGVGPNSSRMLEAALSQYPRGFVKRLESCLNNELKKQTVKSVRKFSYTPFEGHQSRLGHYYRHLFQLIKFVDDQKMKMSEKYECVKTVRAQFSTHEQALLLLNCLTPFGRRWLPTGKEDDGFLLKYKLVKNIPRYFFDPETEFEFSELPIKFPDKYFEWEEHAEF